MQPNYANDYQILNLKLATETTISSNIIHLLIKQYKITIYMQTL